MSGSRSSKPSKFRRSRHSRLLAMGASAFLVATAAGDANSQAADVVEPALGGAPVGEDEPIRRPNYVPPPRREIARPPAPTKEQVEALEMLQAEAAEYEEAAKEHRDVVTSIIRQHYEDKRRRLLASLDSDIEVERKALQEAREDAIRRLEEFVALYSGSNAHPESTPDAMFRLAALYEERARIDSYDDLPSALKSAIALYKRVIREFPEYRELAGIFYYLGHALNDSERLEEAQQVWRSLVCHNQYPYPVPTDRKDSDRDTIVRLPQDHDESFWYEWEFRYPTPESLTRATARGAAEPSYGETVYRDPYPDSCEGIAQKVEEGEEPRYVAEVWWQIGNWHFDQIDPHGGPYNLNRAASAYRQSMKLTRPPLYGVSMYKLAWTYFKQQRYETAVRELVRLLEYTDERERVTGDPGTDFRSEAYTYIAASLTYSDFQGPGPDEPYILRNDVLDLEPNPAIAEQKMRIAIERVQDPTLIPQDRKWTVDVYKGLITEYREVNQWRNAIEVSELILRKWPMYRDAPAIQNEIAEIHDELMRMSRAGTAEGEYHASRALEARTRLAAYVGNTPWVDANRDDPEAIQTAERLVKVGLRRAAADHTNIARAYVQKAQETSAADEQRHWLERALSEYKMADIGWTGYLLQDPNASDAYESKFWIADARRGAIVVAVALGQVPTPAEIDAARSAAVDVRDSNEDDRFLQPAAYYVVDIAEQALESQYALYARSNGTQGIEPRTEVRFVPGDDGREVPASDPLPPAVSLAIQARDEYARYVPPGLDATGAIPIYQYQAADFFFLYGRWDDAKARFEPMWQEHCGQDEWGYRAWERLITMAARSYDVEGSRALAEAEEARSCAVTDDQRRAAGSLTKPVKIGGYFIDAERLFDEAQSMPEGEARRTKWREAAEAFQEALRNGPGHDAAPEAAMNGAFAWRQIGEYDRAIAMYELFIEHYGDDQTLSTMQAEGNPRYEERVGYLKQAYDTLSTAYVQFFSYRRAAETYDKVSQIARFEQQERREAARNALILYANIGDLARMEATRSRLHRLGADAENRAEADFLVADSEYKLWDPRGTDEGANRTARIRAIQAMTRFYDANRTSPAAARYAVEAAYKIGVLRKAAGERAAGDWWRNTIAAFERYKATAGVVDGRNEALGSREAAFGAEAEYLLLDEELRQSFDYDTGHQRFEGLATEVIEKYQAAARIAEQYHNRLQRVIDAYASPEWAAAAIARQGSVYDSLRTGLYYSRPQLFDRQTERILQRFEESDDPDDHDKVDQIRQERMEGWRMARERELAGADEVMVTRYAQSTLVAKRFNVQNPAVDRAIQRLAFFTDVIGEAKLLQYAGNVPELSYSEGLFVRTRPGMNVAPKMQPMTSPLPVLP